MIRFCLLLLSLALAGGSAVAQDAKPAPKPPCAAPEHRQFDFWLGDWEVRNAAGKVVGQNRIASMHNGCVVAESWSGSGGVTGSSLNIYDADRRLWHQTWVDSTGGLLQLEGGWADNRMVLTGETIDAAKPGTVTINRITWTPLPDGRVRQQWDTSSDRGKTWQASFDGYYQQAK